MILQYLKNKQAQVQKQIRMAHTREERGELCVELEDIVHAVSTFSRKMTEEQINDAMTFFPNIFDGRNLSDLNLESQDEAQHIAIS